VWRTDGRTDGRTPHDGKDRAVQSVAQVKTIRCVIPCGVCACMDKPRVFVQRECVASSVEEAPDGDKIARQPLGNVVADSIG